MFSLLTLVIRLVSKRSRKEKVQSKFYRSQNRASPWRRRNIISPRIFLKILQMKSRLPYKWINECHSSLDVQLLFFSSICFLFFFRIFVCRTGFLWHCWLSFNHKENKTSQTNADAQKRNCLSIYARYLSLLKHLDFISKYLLRRELSRTIPFPASPFRKGERQMKITRPSFPGSRDSLRLSALASTRTLSLKLPQ